MTISISEQPTEKRSESIDLTRIPLAKHVRNAMENYFSDLDDQEPADLYRMVINEVEKPLLESVMKQVRGNQSRAAEILGLNRSTLRKKLNYHNI